MAIELQRSFNPNDHLTKVSRKDYLEVKWRLVWFRATCPGSSIETEMLHFDMDEHEAVVTEWNPDKRRNEKVVKRARGMAIFRAIVKDAEGNVGAGTKHENAASFDDFIEKAETGAIGRALAVLGYGTQFTGDEWDEGKRIVDSPVDRESNNASSKQPNTVAQSAAPQRTTTSTEVNFAKEGQVAFLRNRVEAVKPQNGKGPHTTETYYASMFNQPYPGDEALPMHEWSRMIKDLKFLEQKQKTAVPA